MYLDYIKALKCPNNENLLLQIKEKIVVAFWKTLQKASSITPEMIEHTDVLVQKIYYCMDKCSANDDFHGFCKYTYKSIVLGLKQKAGVEDFAEKTGKTLTDNDVRRKIKHAYKQFTMLNSEDKDKFIEYATTHLGFAKQEIEENLFPQRKVSLYVTSKNSEDEYCIADKYIDSTEKIDIEEGLSSKEELENRLSIINNLWLKQKDDSQIVLSELITSDLLSDVQRNNKSEFLIELFSKYDCICKPMMNSFFNDVNYKLPTQQEIGIKYGITKSAASVKLKRFIEKLEKSVKMSTF